MKKIVFLLVCLFFVPLLVSAGDFPNVKWEKSYETRASENYGTKLYLYGDNIYQFAKKNSSYYSVLSKYDYDGNLIDTLSLQEYNYWYYENYVLTNELGEICFYNLGTFEKDSCFDLEYDLSFDGSESFVLDDYFFATYYIPSEHREYFYKYDFSGELIDTFERSYNSDLILTISDYAYFDSYFDDSIYRLDSNFNLDTYNFSYYILDVIDSGDGILSLIKDDDSFYIKKFNYTFNEQWSKEMDLDVDKYELYSIGYTEKYIMVAGAHREFDSLDYLNPTSAVVYMYDLEGNFVSGGEYENSDVYDSEYYVSKNQNLTYIDSVVGLNGDNFFASGITGFLNTDPYGYYDRVVLNYIALFGTEPKESEYRKIISEVLSGEGLLIVQDKGLPGETITFEIKTNLEFEIDSLIIKTKSGRVIEYDKNNSFVMPDEEIVISIGFKSIEKNPGTSVGFIVIICASLGLISLLGLLVSKKKINNL